MKKTQLTKIIKESIKELINEQSPGNPNGPYPPNFNPNNWTQTFDHAMGAGGHPAGQYSNDGPPPNNSNVNCTKVNNRWNNWSNTINTITHQKWKNMLMFKLNHVKHNYCSGYPYYNGGFNPGICGSSAPCI
tara:strand:- start:173 stop:568 length:396 start_codon:yes stop_codon:yes gene_type:complete